MPGACARVNQIRPPHGADVAVRVVGAAVVMVMVVAVVAVLAVEVAVVAVEVVVEVSIGVDVAVAVAVGVFVIVMAQFTLVPTAFVCPLEWQLHKSIICSYN